jgi:ribosome maturation factor RimP
MPLIEALETLIKPVVENEGAYVHELSLVVERGDKFLRILLEKPGSRIDMNLIVQLTRSLSTLLDASGLLNEHYILDIASAGIDYPIKMELIERYINTIIQVYVDPHQQGKPGIIGKLININESTLTLSVKEKNERVHQIFEKKDITRIEVSREQ